MAPSAAIIDSQTVKTSETGGAKGWDGQRFQGADDLGAEEADNSMEGSRSLNPLLADSSP